MFGPWDRFADLEPFLGDQPHPPGAGYYPEDMTREEFEAWLEAHPEDAEAFTSLHHDHSPLRADGEGLVAVPYSTAFCGELEQRQGGPDRQRRRSPTTPACSVFSSCGRRPF